MSITHLPVLRNGQPYESLDRTEVVSLRNGDPVASVSQANAAMIRRDLRRASRESLRAIPTRTLIEISCKAGELFMEADLPLSNGQTQSAQEYVESLSATSGLPHTLVRRNMAKIHQVFTQMETILRGLTRGLDLYVIDHGTGEQAGVPVSYFAATDRLGVVLPSNSPGVNSLWMPAIPLKVPVVLKPGREEPWTPFRIMQAFIAAGCPADAFSFYPTDHEGSAAVMESCDRALIFGDVSTVERYAANPGVQVHGPGWSKVVLGEDVADRWPEFVDVIVDSIAENGGRSCVNASCIITPRHADAIADAVAQKLASRRPRPADDPEAVLSGFANPKMAEFIDASIEEGLRTPGSEDVASRYREGGRKVVLDGVTFLQPTLVRCDRFDHPLADREFLFPYASVVEMPEEQVLEQIGPSLVVTLISDSDRLIDQYIGSPKIDRLNIGPLATSRVQWDQPHEGNLFEFLYRRRAIQRA